MNAGAFTCRDCGAGPGASGSTYSVLRMCAGKSYNPAFVTPDGKKRALRLLREYLAHKTDYRFQSLSEYIRLI